MHIRIRQTEVLGGILGRAKVLNLSFGAGSRFTTFCVISSFSPPWEVVLAPILQIRRLKFKKV